MGDFELLMGDEIQYFQKVDPDELEGFHYITFRTSCGRLRSRGGWFVLIVSSREFGAKLTCKRLSISGCRHLLPIKAGWWHLTIWKWCFFAWAKKSTLKNREDFDGQSDRPLMGISLGNKCFLRDFFGSKPLKIFSCLHHMIFTTLFSSVLLFQHFYCCEGFCFFYFLFLLSFIFLPLLYCLHFLRGIQCYLPF